mmetsp:Transcript_3225/g.10661  ORF Transcript_3225/g.10661 Transcript_3225/m.10661 type:complete len:585 (+) Transcript_3225:82-1836(+)
MDAEKHAIVDAIVAVHVRDPIAGRADVLKGREVRERLMTAGTPEFQAMRVEILAYLIREPHLVDAFISAYEETQGDVDAALSSAAAATMPKGTVRHLPRQGTSKFFAPEKMRRLLDPKDEAQLFDHLVDALVVLERKLADLDNVEEDNELEQAMLEVARRAKRIEGFAGLGTYFTEHLLGDRFVKRGASFPGSKLAAMSQRQKKHIVELASFFGDVEGVREAARRTTISCAGGVPLLDLRILRYAICTMQQTVGKKDESLFDLAVKYLRENTRVDESGKRSVVPLPPEASLTSLSEATSSIIAVKCVSKDGGSLQGLEYKPIFNSRRWVPVDVDWLLENGYGWVVQRCLEEKDQAVDIPPGRRRRKEKASSAIEDGAALFEDTDRARSTPTASHGPGLSLPVVGDSSIVHEQRSVVLDGLPVPFRQGARNDCLRCAVMNGLFLCGRVRRALSLSESLRYLPDVCADLQRGGGFNVRKLLQKAGLPRDRAGLGAILKTTLFDAVSNAAASSRTFFLVQLLDQTMADEHVVAVHCKAIYDSNQAAALPFSAASLDACAGGPGYACVGIKGCLVVSVVESKKRRRRK